MEQQYAEAIEKTETEAKAAVEAFVTHALMAVGMESIQNKLIEMPHSKLLASDPLPQTEPTQG